MKLDDDLMFADDLPVEARRLIERVETNIADVRRTSDQSILTLRDAADREIADIRTKLARDEAAVQTEASRQLSPLVKELFEQLKTIQVQYTQKGMLDEALAVRSRVRAMRADLFGVRPDPGNMTDYTTTDIGRSYLFDIVGEQDGNVWGTDMYTGDSSVAAAAVHAGVLRPGERGLVRVTLVDGSSSMFDASERYGIRSQEYGNFTVAYAVERV